MPVATNPRFTPPGGEFSVSYPAPGAAYDVTIDADGVTAVWTAGDGGTLRLFSQAADGRNAEQVAGSLMDDLFPDARIAYQLPNAAVGYRPGYGHVADFQPMVASYQSTLLRVIIVVAVKNDLALIALAAGPFHEFTPSFRPGPPSQRTCRSRRIWASTSTVSPGAAIHRGEVQPVGPATRVLRPPGPAGSDSNGWLPPASP